MALPATHIRFAITVAARLTVKDPGVRLAGVRYPGSRRATGIDRDQAHAPRRLDPDFPSDDLPLGRHIHCLCDRIQGKFYDGLLVGSSALTPEARWIRSKNLMACSTGWWTGGTRMACRYLSKGAMFMTHGCGDRR